MLPEPWNTLLFLVAIPVVHQLVKLYRDRTGNTIGKLGNQLISLVLATAFAVLSGGFAGFDFPSLPVWGGDLVEFVGSALTFASDLVVVLGLAWGSLMALYEGILDRLFVAFRFATADKY